MPTIFDVAKAAGVSIASVSLVINDPHTPRVGNAKREEILRIAKKVGYSPNFLAKSLRTHGTGIVGLVVPMHGAIFYNPFIAEVLSGIQTYLSENSYHLIVYSHTSAHGKITRTQLMQSKCTDGLIFINTRLCTENDIQGTIRELQSARTPFVMINSYCGGEINYLGVDEFQIGHTAAKYLCDRGHQKIALIAGSKQSPASPPLIEGFQRALSEAGVKVNKRWLTYGEFDRDVIRAAAGRLLKSKERPTAVFCASDQMVPDLYEFLKQEQVRIPEDLAVVGRGNLMFASYLAPSLTTVHVPAFDLGYKAAGQLIKSLNDPTARPQQALLPCQIIQRESA